MPDQSLNGNLQHLLDELLAMGGLVEAMLIESVDLLKRCDLDGLEQLGDAERRIREKRLAIEMGCLNLISVQQPKAGDLRLAVAMVEIASDLERIGEHAKNVAGANCLTLEHHFRRPFMSIQRMAAEAQAMLSLALAALVQRDIQATQQVFHGLPKVEDLYRGTYHELLDVMNIRPRAANQAIYLSRAAYNLKRAAERITGICEWVMFTLVGAMEKDRPNQPELVAKGEFAHQDSVAL
jgi:phosphate transport system protein